MYFTSQMPMVNVEALRAKLSAEDFFIAQGALVSRGKNKGRLRASSPKQPYKVAKDKRNRQGLIYYAWRLAAFLCSPRGEHQCMPFSATFYLDAESDGYDNERVKVAQDRGMAIAEAIADCIPKAEHHGVKRWGRALGYL